MDIKRSKRRFVNIYDSEIGRGTRIAEFVEIGGAKIGKKCSIQAFVFICPGIEIGDGVFLGPGVIFTNDKHPKANKRGFIPEKTVVGNNVVIGAGAVILPGIVIGEGAVIGAGSVVTKNVEAGAVVFGNPAKEHK